MIPNNIEQVYAATVLCWEGLVKFLMIRVFIVIILLALISPLNTTQRR